MKYTLEYTKDKYNKGEKLSIFSFGGIRQAKMVVLVKVALANGGNHLLLSIL